MRHTAARSFLGVRLICILSLIALGLLMMPPTAAVEARPETRAVLSMSPAVHHDLSARLSSLSPAKFNAAHASTARRTRALKTVQTFAQTGAITKDPVQQPAQPLTPVGFTKVLGFPGVGYQDYGYAPYFSPPDTTLAVGDDQIVQWVNTSFAVFDKATGELIYGPIDGNALWQGFGGGCETNNDGDISVQWDQIAHRWVLSQFSVSTFPYLQCWAVSTSADATGSYYRYSWQYNDFPDYPKIGVWPDAYYVSFNMYTGGVTFKGALICGVDRAKMILGLVATQACLQFDNKHSSFLPADLDGTTLPPAGAREYFVYFTDTTHVKLLKWHIDFVTPANNNYTTSSVTVPAFAEACAGGACIQQPYPTTEQLDSLADRFMYRLSYRKFAAYESLLINQSVVNSWSTSGIRWYEVRSPATTPVLYQSSTYAPDGTYRWMGSIAQDKLGNIALGYSVSSYNTFPSIRITGRLVTDAVNTLRAEKTVLGGLGSQNDGLTRWGDYSTMDVDPVGGCIFYYTNQYQKLTGSFDWSTYIYAFKYPTCS